MSSNDLDSFLNIIADQRRRHIIEALQDNGGDRTKVDDLIDQIVRRERRVASNRPPDRDEIAVELYHYHLPKLSEAGVVEYDRRRDMVRYFPREGLEAVLESLPEEHHPFTQ